MMGLDELNFLKETLLNIDEIDEEINKLNQESQESKINISNKKETIKNLQNRVIEYDNQVKKAQKSSQEIHVYSNLVYEVDKMATREGDREMKVFDWEEELDSYWKDSHKKVGGLGFLNGMIVFCLFSMIILILSAALIKVLIGDNTFLHKTTEETTRAEQIIVVLYTILIAFCSAYLTDKISVNIKIKRYQKTKKIIESEFGELGYFSSIEIEHLSYTYIQKYGAYCLSKGHRPDSDVWGYNDDMNKILIYTKMNERFSSLTRHLVPKILIPTDEEKSEIKRIEKQQDEVIALKKYISQGEKAKLEIPKHKEKINLETKDTKQLGTLVESNKSRVKQLDSERAILWESISHMIPYSNLIKQ